MGEQYDITATRQVTIIYGQSMPYAVAPERAGFKFGGYFSEKDGKGDQYYNEYMDSTHIFEGIEKVYAYWIPAQYDVQYMTASGNALIHTQTVDYLQDVTILNAAQVGYETSTGESLSGMNLGWSDKVNNPTFDYRAGDTVTSGFWGADEANKIGVKLLYAVVRKNQKFSVKYDANGGYYPSELKTPPQFLYNDGDVVPIMFDDLDDETTNAATFRLPLRDGYTFVGCSYRDENGMEKTAYLYETDNTAEDGFKRDARGDLIQASDEDLEEAKFVISNETTLYAQWIADQYTITYDGTESDAALGAGKSNEQKVTRGTTGNQFYGDDIYSREGYDQQGWTKYKQQAQNGLASYSFHENIGSDFISAQDDAVTVFAAWQAKNHTVTLNYNDPKEAGGQNATPDFDFGVTYGKVYGSDLYDPTREGYTFKGWWQNYGLDNETEIKRSTIVTTDTDHTLTAKWEAVDYPINVSVIDESSSAGVSGLKIADYKLSGTNVDADNSTAQFEAEVTVKVAPDQFRTIDGIRVTVNGDEVTRTGEGSVDSSDGKTYYQFKFTMPAKATNVYISANGDNGVKYNVHYDVVPADLEAAIQCDDIDEVHVTSEESTLASAPTYTEGAGGQYLHFLGWADTATGSVRYQAGQSIVTPLTTAPNGTVTLYGVWEDNRGYEYHIVYDANGGTASGDDIVNNKYKVQMYENILGDEAMLWDGGVYSSIGENPDSNNKMEREGYTLMGWALNAESTTATYSLGYSPTSPLGYGDRDVILYAVWKAGVYRIIYDANEGIGEPDMQYKTRDVDLTLSNTRPTRDGYTFLGWSKDKNATAADSNFAPGATYSTDENLTLYAVWEGRDYTVTYDYQGATGGNEKERDTVKYNQTLATLPVPTRTGYAFVGWFTTPTSGSQFISEDKATDENPATKVTESIALYAHWTTDKFKINYDGNAPENGLAVDNVPEAQDKYSGVTLTLTDAVPVVSGYVFIGWNRERNGSGTSYNSAAEFNAEITEDITLYAQWTKAEHVLTLDPNGGKVSPFLAGKNTGDNYDGLPIPTRSGYAFEGWYKVVPEGTQGAETFTAEDGRELPTIKVVNENSATIGGAKVNADDGSFTLIAGWIADKYKITYIGNPPIEGETVENLPEPVDKYRGIMITLSDKIPTMSGYKFIGWNREADGTGTAYDASGEFNVEINEDIELYAQWEDSNGYRYNVIYDVNGGVASGDKMVNGQYKTLMRQNILADDGKLWDGGSDADSNKFTREGYTLIGWSTYPEGTTATYSLGYAPTAPLGSEDQDVTLYAVWKAGVYSVIYNANGGVSEPDRQFKTHGVNLTLANARPTRTGYTFLGWNTDRNATEPDNKYAPGATYRTDAELTLYAVWMLNVYTITYEYQGATDGNNKLSDKVRYQQTIASLPTPTRIGYKFKGWFTTPTGSSEFVAGETQVTDNISIYAQWEPDKFTITYIANSPSSSVTVKNMPEPQDKYSGITLTISPLVPTVDGYTFAGWNTVRKGTGASYNAGGEFNTELTDDIILYAQWINAEHTLTLNPNGGNVSPLVAGKNTGDNYDGLPVPVRNGYTFDGWYKAVSAGTPGASDFTDVDGNKIKTIKVVDKNSKTIGNAKVGGADGNFTLIAGWTATSYDIVYNSNDGTDETRTQTVLLSGGQRFDSNTEQGKIFSRTGYTFTGWNTSADGNGTHYGAGDTITANFAQAGDEVTLYAEWSPQMIQVKLDTQISGVVPQVIEVAYGKNYTGLTVPTRSGYSFAGWFTGTGNDADEVTTETIVENAEPHTLYAHWSNWDYTVNYYVNSSQYDLVNEAHGVTSENGSITLPEITNKDTFKRDGYTLTGWNTTPDGTGTPYSLGADILASSIKGSTLNLYAQWAQNTIQVTFNPNGTSEAPGSISVGYSDTKSVAYGAGYGELPQAERAGYAFDGWYTDAAQGTLVTSSTKVTNHEDHVLYAHWTQADHVIMLNADGGTVNPSTKTLPTGSAYNGFPIPSKSGYTFLGWMKDGSLVTTGEGNSLSDRVTVQASDGNFELVAKWEAQTYDITYNANGGTGEIDAAAKKHGEDITLSGGAELKRDGYVLLGWNTKIDGTGKDYALGATYTQDAGLDLYAVWQEGEYAVIYMANGGLNAPEGQVKSKGQPFTLSETVPSREGYTFLGWSTNKNAVSPNSRYAPGSTYTDNADLRLYAIWSINSYTVTYNYQGATAGNETKNTVVEYKGTIPAKDLPSPTKDDYYFAGWFTTPADGTQFVADETQVTKDITLYAHWNTRAFNVYFDVNKPEASAYDVDGAPEPLAKQNGKALTLYTVVPTLAGYTCTGWNTKKDGSGALYAAGSEFDTEITDDITLYAQWSLVNYSISYELDGGRLSNQKTEYNVNTDEFTLPVPTRDGYIFQGWTGSNGVTTEKDVKVKKGTTGNLSYVAHWNGNSYAVNYYPNVPKNAAGEVTDMPVNTTKTHESSITLSSTAPSLNGYVFTGWNTAADGSGKSYKPNDIYAIDEPLELYAQWTKNEYAVSVVYGDGITASLSKTKVGHGETVSIDVTLSEEYMDAVITPEPVQNASVTSKANVYTITGPVTFKVTASKRGVYTVNYNWNYSGSPEAVYTSSTAYQNSADEAAPVIKLPANPTRNGYLFDGWFTNADGSGEQINDGYALTKSLELYAKWTVSDYEITLPEGDGFKVESDDGTTVSRGNDYTFTVNIDDHYDGSKMQVFSNGVLITETGHTNDPNGKVTSRSYKLKKVTEPKNIEVLGVVLESYKVVFIDGDATYNTISVGHNEKLSKPSISAKEGMQLVGWNKKPNEEDRSTDWNFNEDIVTEDTVLYAQWEEVVYTVTFPAKAANKAAFIRL